jgi:hypothetical protein
VRAGRFEATAAPGLFGTKVRTMKTSIARTYVLFGTLVGPARVVIARDSDAKRPHPIAVVKDSVHHHGNQDHAGHGACGRSGTHSS